MPGFECFGEEERKEVNEVLETGILMRYGFDALRKERWKALEFEKELAAKFQVKHVQLTSSGTAALTVALQCLGVGAGDEVLCPTFTFVASFEAILSVGAIPIFVDVDDSLCMSPKSIKSRITNKTKAVMPVHMCGAMADLNAIKKICAEFNLYLIEDACQAIGGSYQGNALGTIGDIGVLSFDFVKTITAGEGGALLINKSQNKLKADAYQDHGHDHLGKNRGLDTPLWIGYNYRISELHAAVGLAQLRKLDQILNKQRAIKNLIKEELSQIPKIEFRKVHDQKGDNAGFLSFFTPNESSARKVIKALSDAGIDYCFYWYEHQWHYIKKWPHLKQLNSLSPLPKETIKAWEKEQKRTYEASDKIISKTISLLIKQSWSIEKTKEEAAKIKKIIAKSLKNVNL